MGHFYSKSQSPMVRHQGTESRAKGGFLSTLEEMVRNKNPNDGHHCHIWVGSGEGDGSDESNMGSFYSNRRLLYSASKYMKEYHFSMISKSASNLDVVDLACTAHQCLLRRRHCSLGFEHTTHKLCSVHAFPSCHKTLPEVPYFRFQTAAPSGVPCFY